MNPFEARSNFTMAHGRAVVDGVQQRMIERHRRVVEASPDCFEGQDVLDLASHNGRWTYAALMAGASYVLGIEGRQELIDRGLADFEGIEPSRYHFVQGDIYDQREIAASVGRTSFDTVLCLGIFYHIADHYRLIRQMRAFNPKAIIIDTPLVSLDAPMIRFGTEDPADPSNAISEQAGAPAGIDAGVTASMRGIASVGFIRLAAQLSGYTMSTIPWKRAECQYPGAVEDYLDTSRDARRMTVVLRATAATPRW